MVAFLGWLARRKGWLHMERILNLATRSWFLSATHVHIVISHSDTIERHSLGYHNDRRMRNRLLNLLSIHVDLRWRWISRNSSVGWGSTETRCCAFAAGASDCPADLAHTPGAKRMLDANMRSSPLNATNRRSSPLSSSKPLLISTTADTQIRTRSCWRSANQSTGFWMPKTPCKAYSICTASWLLVQMTQ